MLSDIIRRLFGSHGEDYRFDDGDILPRSAEQFGSSGLPSSVEEDLRRRYLNSDQHGDEQEMLGMLPHNEHQSIQQMFGEMEELFRGFLGGSDFGMTFNIPSNMDQIPYETMEFEDGHSSSGLRRKMLEEPQENEPIGQFFPGFHRSRIPNSTMQDRNLDDDFDSGNLSIDTILQNDPPGEQRLLPPFRDAPSSSGYRFSSVTTTRKADGTIERKTTVRDSNGNEEVSVSRTIGDQTHTIKKKVDANGQEETNEQFVNMDEGESSHFADAWSTINKQGLDAGTPEQLNDKLHTKLYDSIKHFLNL